MAAVGGGVALGGGCALSRSGEPDSPEGMERPGRGHNVLLITADDMRWDEAPTMPNLQRLLAERGTTFTSCRPEVPVCSPARAGLLTGQYSTHHEVLTQGDHLEERPADLLAAWLADAGVSCGMIGKYLTALGTAARPGWSFWRALVDQPQMSYGYVVSDGTDRIEPEEHIDDYLSATAIEFLDERAGSPDVPWFCWVNPTSPHWPAEPRPDRRDLFADVRWPTVDPDEDVSTKPSWIRARPQLDEDDVAKAQSEQQGRLRELVGVDQMVADLVQALDENGQLDRTIIVFTSDNGVMLGEHRWRLHGKGTPYDESLRVPLVVRGPGFEAGTTVDVPCQHQDLTRMLLTMYGASPTVEGQVGVDLSEIAADPEAHAARAILHTRAETPLGEGATPEPGDAPAAHGVTTVTSKLWRYQDGGSLGTLDAADRYEMYDLAEDPAELRNLANDPARRAERDELERRLDALLGT